MTQFILEQGPQETDPGSIYGRTDIFEIPQRGYIEMMYLKIILQSNAARSGKSSLAAFEIIESATLESEGVAFCRDDHVYGQCRTYQLHMDSYEQVSKPATLSAAFNGTSPTLIRPLFFSAFDNGNHILASEGLTVRVITKSSPETMGLTGGITGLSIRLKIKYRQAPEYIEKPLVATYNSRLYTGISLPAGSTSYRLKLNCPFDVISLMFMIKKPYTAAAVVPGDRAANNTTISSVELTYPNGEYGLYENDTDFSLTSTGSMEHNISMFIVSFGTRTDPEAIKLNRGMNPTIATLRFAATLAGAVLYHVIEYRSTLEYSNGRFVELIKDSTR